MEWSIGGFFAVFLSGLALNLTPCVYPMLSVSVALFSGKTNRGVAENFFRSLTYVAGIVVMYSTLGIIAAATGKLFGFVFESTFTLILIAGFLFFLSMSMFGLYEITVPSALLTFAGNRKKAGYLGLFFSGLLVGLFAAPCTGPPILALLTLVGSEGNVVTGFFVFFVLSCGLGLPYLVLGTYSGLLEKLPRSGDWMLWVKKLFGFILLGLSFYFISIALYGGLLSILLPLLLLVAGAYLGFIESSGGKLHSFRRIKQILGGTAVLAAVVIFFQPKEGVVWVPYSEPKVEAAANRGQPVIIDFYADWCLACMELKQFTFTNQAVREALQPFLKIQADLTDPDAPAAAAVIEKYKVSGVPLIIFLDANGKEIESARISGFVGPEEFLHIVRPLTKGDG